MKSLKTLKGLYAYPDVGRAGLCNMLFPWARAVLFSHTWQCPMIAPQWTNYFRLGPWLRRERDKRYYFNNFTNAGYIKGLNKMSVMLKFMKKRIYERNVLSNDISIMGGGGV